MVLHISLLFLTYNFSHFFKLQIFLQFSIIGHVYPSTYMFLLFDAYIFNCHLVPFLNTVSVFFHMVLKTHFFRDETFLILRNIIGSNLLYFIEQSNVFD